MNAYALTSIVLSSIAAVLTVSVAVRQWRALRAPLLTPEVAATGRRWRRRVLGRPQPQIRLSNVYLTVAEPQEDPLASPMQPGGVATTEQVAEQFNHLRAEVLSLRDKSHDNAALLNQLEQRLKNERSASEEDGVRWAIVNLWAQSAAAVLVIAAVILAAISTVPS